MYLIICTARYCGLRAAALLGYIHPGGATLPRSSTFTTRYYSPPELLCTMIRISLAIVLIALSAVDTNAFSRCGALLSLPANPSSIGSHRQQRLLLTSLNAMSTNRRSIAASVATSLAAVFTASSLQPLKPAIATEKWVYDNAKEVVVVNKYRPKFDDLNQLYGLGRSLDNLNAKVLDEAKWNDALAGLRSFNRDGNFYTVSDGAFWKRCLALLKWLYEKE